ncbi:nitrite reductase [NAD(P)H] large subunit NirB [Mycobacterium tuberculosis MAL020179]|nr:nitrite reductase [NAD(P)H] large subunit NirB [Mycobacterium tuberculosis MAL020179]
MVGHGMVGHRLVEAVRARDADGSLRITVLAEEGDAAYDRVGLTSYTESWDRALLALPGNDYAGDQRVRLLLNTRVTQIDRATKSVVTAAGQRHRYDTLVLATGSYAFVPPVPGHDLPACHVYRTFDDLDAIRAGAQRTLDGGHTDGGVVIGGGLLGLEAANALRQFGLQTHVVEMMPRLMAQQIDEAGGALLARMIADLGIAVHVGTGTESIESVKHSDGSVWARVRLSDGEVIDAGVVIFAAGIRPRDELARAAGLAIGDRGGVLTDLSCRTSDPDIYAVGTVKSCVGSDWCRYGQQDSVQLAIDLELRYRGLRAPHKIKLGVSGCARECAEARGKDVGVIATEKGWNLYVAGNGGMTPKHAQLLASDLDKETLIRYIDRFLIYYIRTADRLQRTAPWVESLGLDHVREVVCEDSLGLAEEFEAAMQRHVANYKCEWKGVLEDPDKLSRFVSFVNAPDAVDSTVTFTERAGRKVPVSIGIPRVRS